MLGVKRLGLEVPLSSGVSGSLSPAAEFLPQRDGMEIFQWKGRISMVILVSVYVSTHDTLDQLVKMSGTEIQIVRVTIGIAGTDGNCRDSSS